MNEINENFGLGWVRDLPDFRDYSPENEKLNHYLRNLIYCLLRPVCP